MAHIEPAVMAERIRGTCGIVVQAVLVAGAEARGMLELQCLIIKEAGIRDDSPTQQIVIENGTQLDPVLCPIPFVIRQIDILANPALGAEVIVHPGKLIIGIV